MPKNADVNLSSERKIKEELNKSNYKLIIADPFMKQLVKKDSDARFYENPQYAVSSKIHGSETARMTGAHFNTWINEQDKK